MKGILIFICNQQPEAFCIVWPSYVYKNESIIAKLRELISRQKNWSVSELIYYPFL